MPNKLFQETKEETALILWLWLLYKNQAKISQVNHRPMSLPTRNSKTLNETAANWTQQHPKPVMHHD